MFRDLLATLQRWILPNHQQSGGQTQPPGGPGAGGGGGEVQESGGPQTEQDEADREAEEVPDEQSECVTGPWRWCQLVKLSKCFFYLSNTKYKQHHLSQVY